jgi:hypothetical protein
LVAKFSPLWGRTGNHTPRPGKRQPNVLPPPRLASRRPESPQKNYTPQRRFPAEPKPDKISPLLTSNKSQSPRLAGGKGRGRRS